MQAFVNLSATGEGAAAADVLSKSGRERSPQTGTVSLLHARGADVSSWCMDSSCWGAADEEDASNRAGTEAARSSRILEAASSCDTMEVGCSSEAYDSPLEREVKGRSKEFLKIRIRVASEP